MYIRDSLLPAVAALLAVTFLAGCANGGGMPSALLRAQQSNVDNRIDPGPLEERERHEKLKSSGGNAMNPCLARQHGGYVTFNASGSTTVPYPGTFVGNGQFYFQCHPGATSLTAAFTITSGANTITGTIDGNAKIFDFHFVCLAHSKDFTFAATLWRGGKVRKRWSGRASGQFGISSDNAVFSATLASI